MLGDSDDGEVSIVRVGVSNRMGITLPITMGLPMGVTWPATPPMTRAHTRRRWKEGGKASPNQSTDSGFSDSEASPSSGGSKENFRLHFNRKEEEEHFENASSLSTSQNAKDPKNAGGKSKGELS